MIEPPQPVDKLAPAVSAGAEWNNVITLTLTPNTKLNDGQKPLIEKDYGMPDGRLQLQDQVRKALAHYTLQRYQAAMTSVEADNESQYQIQLIETDRKNSTLMCLDQTHD